MELKWWDQLDLDLWCTDAPASAVGMRFAQAIAAKRALSRGCRQRITAGHRLPSGRTYLEVRDAPERVAEPCS